MPPRRAAAAKASQAIAKQDSPSPPASPPATKRKASTASAKVKRTKTADAAADAPVVAAPVVAPVAPVVPVAASSSADAPVTKSVIVKGKAAVDSLCPLASSHHVYADASGPWDFTGNQTNIGSNNNKFYIIQLLESDSGGSFKVWTRWGRVGVPGQNAYLPGGTLYNCQVEFEKKFKDKTSNNWANRANFVKVAGKYDLVRIDYAADDAEEIESALAKVPAKPRVESKLKPEVKSLMELIFDEKRMTDAIIEMKYDVKKLPLGKLTTDQIKLGYQALKDIEDCIKSGNRRDLEQACSDFYTRIPHSFGMTRPPLITTIADVKTKLELLEALSDVKIALSLIKSGGDSSDQETAVIDTKYKSLNVDLQPLDKKSEEFQLIQTYLKNTHGQTHSNFSLEILDAFSVDKDLPFKPEVGNRQLLWHGSRLTNWVGILSQGLRIAPPEAPCTGYMFGKGVYFADMVSKSANYCFTSKSNNTGVMLLCEVALGTQNKLLNADNNLHLHTPKGTHSTLGMGQNAPDPAQTVVRDGVQIPLGKGAATGVTNPQGFTLAYNEFIVYDTAQIKFRYALKLKFNHKY